MFRLNIDHHIVNSTFMSTSKLNDSALWHAGLGHEPFKRMQDMSKEGLILAFDMDTEKCKTCMLTKITKKSFQIVKQETKLLEFIHSDLCDLHATPSLGNKKYFVTFIDDAYKFCYVYLLHTKYEALDKFKVFKTEVELQQGALIKRFRTNREGEYMDTFYFQSVGIIHKTTAPYTLQQNGISERKNKTDSIEIEYDGSEVPEKVSEEKEAINDEMDSIMDNNTWVLVDLPTVAHISTIRLLIAVTSTHNLIIHHMDVKTAFLNGELLNDMLIFGTHQVHVDLTKDFLSSRFFMKDMGEADVILSIKIKHEMSKLSRYTSNPSTYHWQAIQGVLKYLKKTRNYSLSYARHPSVLKGYTNASWIINTKDNSSTSSWVFFLGEVLSHGLPRSTLASQIQQ
ncbi:zinc finger, CCHC-type containing protein [Tanacetum coccineum]